MVRTVAIGNDDFASIVENNDFYIDKTEFIREWWNSRDKVTLITRPRRFGKTLNLSMLNYFFSNRHQGREDLFEGLRIWDDEAFHALQGSYPVIFLTFADVKADNWKDAREFMNNVIATLYDEYAEMMQDPMFSDSDRKKFQKVDSDMGSPTAAVSLRNLCDWLHRYYKKRVLIFLDEYDTPMQEAWVSGYWDKMTAYVRSLFNSTFKTNPHLERALLTGITRVSKESIFSDLNNLEVVSTTSEKYETSFGFTETEVFQALEQQGFSEKERDYVKRWYDGFTFGRTTDIYNPWSVSSYIDKRKLGLYWANTSSNRMIDGLLQKGKPQFKIDFEDLLEGKTVEAEIDEQIVFSQLAKNQSAVWSLLLASGYLKVDHLEAYEEIEESIQKGKPVYSLMLTNYEVELMFRDMISKWFNDDGAMSDFVAAMLSGDAKTMNCYMNDIALNTMSYFDSGTKPSVREPENFYHGLVLGLLVDQTNDYEVKSNRESGYGRYDVVMEPKKENLPAVILEFKVFNEEEEEKSLEDTVKNALNQIEEMKYDTDLLNRGIPKERILKYGLAFRGKKCLIRKASQEDDF